MTNIEKQGAIRLIKSIAVFFVPLIICFFYLLIRGSFNLYLPDSYNNDCLFYYKLVEGIVRGGSLKGYFGFNESSALVGGFAAWNPAVVLPWLLFGFIFRWGYSSVFFCNIFFFSAALAAFTYLTDIPVKKLIPAGVLLLLFPSLPIHLLNALPEAVITSFAILYFGFAVACCREGSGERVSDGGVPTRGNARFAQGYIIGMLLCSMYLTVCRPYMILFFILPMFFLLKQFKTGKSKVAVAEAGAKAESKAEIKTRKTAILWFIVCCAAIVISLLVYILTNHFFTAAYFEPLFNTDIIKMFLHGKFAEGFWTAVSVTKKMLGGIGDYIADAFSFGFTAGTHYVITIVCTVLLLIQLFGKKNKELKPVYFLYVLTSVLLFPAIVLFLQKVNEGGRHVWFLAVIGIILVSLTEWDAKGIASKGIIAVLLIFFIVRGGLYPTDYDVPFRQQGTEEKIAFWKDTFEKENVKPEGKISFDNTIIWVYFDYDDDGKMVVTDYNSLYAVPAGMGISCCEADYVLSNIDSLKSRFLATAEGGKVDEALKERGLSPLESKDGLMIYRLR